MSIYKHVLDYDTKMFEKGPKMGILSTFGALILMAGYLLSSPLSFAQQETQSLTPEEQAIQDRTIQTQQLTTASLLQVAGGSSFVSRWSPVEWIEPNSISVLFVDCMPGEFPVLSQQILQSSDLNVLQSFGFAINPNYPTRIKGH